MRGMSGSASPRITYHVTESVHAQGEGVHAQISFEVVLLDLGNVGIKDSSTVQRQKMRR